MFKIEILPALSDNYIFLICNLITKKVIAVDPSESKPVLRFLKEHDLELSHIIITHHHYDHVGGNLELKNKTKCQIIGSKEDQNRIPGIDKTLIDQEEFFVNSLKLKAIETPGHTIGAISYYIEELNSLFCGDTLFSCGCGRLFEGTATQMLESLKKIKSLPQDTFIYCAHEYTLKNILFALTIEPKNMDLQKKLKIVEHKRASNKPSIPSTLKEEMLTNPFLRTAIFLSKEKADEIKILQEAQIFKNIRKKRDVF